MVGESWLLSPTELQTYNKQHENIQLLKMDLDKWKIFKSFIPTSLYICNFFTKSSLVVVLEYPQTYLFFNII